MAARKKADTGQIKSTDDVNDVKKIDFMIRQRLARMSTLRQVKVVAVHLPKDDKPDGGTHGQVEKSGTLDVQPLVSMTDGAGKSTPHGVIYGIPYHRHQGGKNATILDPVVGDVGLAMVSDRDISALVSQYAKKGKIEKEANPGSHRRFDLSDSVYLGGWGNEKPEQYRSYTDDSFTDNATKNANKNATTINDKTSGGDINHTSEAKDNAGGNINHTAKKKDNAGGNITHTAEKDITHTASNNITQTASGSHTITAPTHNINALTNIANLLKVSSVAQLMNFTGGALSGGSSPLTAAKNLIGSAGTLSSFNLTMPTADTNGNPLVSGLTTSVAFERAVTALSIAGPVQSAQPASVSAGQKLAFVYNAATATWWND